MENYAGYSRGGGQPSEDDHQACPDCGNAMEQLPFKVLCNDEAIALRVYACYMAMQGIPESALEAVVLGNQHVHIVQGNGDACAESKS